MTSTLCLFQLRHLECQSLVPSTPSLPGDSLPPRQQQLHQLHACAFLLFLCLANILSRCQLQQVDSKRILELLQWQDPDCLGRWLGLEDTWLSCEWILALACLCRRLALQLQFNMPPNLKLPVFFSSPAAISNMDSITDFTSPCFKPVFSATSLY